jgi:putative PIN family toxin of toxin-antitoxin system
MKLVLDTNIVLDLFVFRDEAVRPLREALAKEQVQWLASPPMRDELACVLAYEHIGARMTTANVSAQQVLASFDEHASIVEPAPPAKVVCRDTDDQKFIDLAVARKAALVSKDKQVLTLRKKLAMLDVAVAKTWRAPTTNA